MECQKLSFIIPCYRSENTILTVIYEIIEEAESLGIEYEIVAVNDSSPDNVWEVIRAYAKESAVVKAVDLTRNMGKHAAVMAGFSVSTGDVIITLDDDGQCPVDHLRELLEPLSQGYDVSIARYPQKKQSALKNLGSAINDKMACLLIDKPKDLKLSNFYAIKRFILVEILKYHNPYPYISGLLLRATSRIANVEMEERGRISGSTGYTLAKSIKLLINGFTAFSVKPLRTASVLGVVMASSGFLFALYIIIEKIIHPDIVAGYSSLMAVILFVGGIIMLFLGLIGEYIGRIYISLNNLPQFVIREIVNGSPADRIKASDGT